MNVLKGLTDEKLLSYAERIKKECRSFATKTSSAVKHSRAGRSRVAGGDDDDDDMDVSPTTSLSSDSSRSNACFTGAAGVQACCEALRLPVDKRNQALDLMSILLERGYIVHWNHSLKSYVDKNDELYRFVDDCRKVFLYRSQDAYAQRDQIFNSQLLRRASESSIQKQRSLTMVLSEVESLRRHGSFGTGKSSPMSPVSPVTAQNPFFREGNVAKIIIDVMRQNGDVLATAEKLANQPASESLRDLLSNDKERELFRQFAKYEHNDLLVIFWEQLKLFEDLQTEDEVQLQAFARQLFLLFLGESSLYSLNLSSEFRKECAEKIAVGDLSFLSKAKNEILMDLTDVYLRFISSPIWQDYKRGKSSA